MSDLAQKVKDQIDVAAKTTKKATDKATNKTKDAVHAVGKKMVEGGKTLKNA